MKIKRIGESRLEPAIRLRVRCNREDLLISNLSFKSPKVLGHMGWQQNKNKEAAAAAYIKSRLVDSGLTPSDFDESYSLIFLADMAVSQEVV